jgi:hypothetical protein
MRLTALFLFLALASCQTTDKLRKCKGPAFGLNSAHWQPTRRDIKACGPNVIDQSARM